MVGAAANSVYSPFRFSGVVVQSWPYPHLEAADFLEADIADSLLTWLAREPEWQPRKLAGYAGYSDISLQAGDLPPQLDFLLAPHSLSYLRICMAQIFQMDPEGYVRVTAHRLLAGSSLRAHCDVSPLRFTHRLIVQLNRGWTRGNGGLLCLFDGESSAKRRRHQKVIMPVHRSAFGFEISDRSFHAVTRVISGERYTLSYTFYPPSGKQV